MRNKKYWLCFIIFISFFFISFQEVSAQTCKYTLSDRPFDSAGNSFALDYRAYINKKEFGISPDVFLGLVRETEKDLLSYNSFFPTQDDFNKGISSISIEFEINAVGSLVAKETRLEGPPRSFGYYGELFFDVVSSYPRKHKIETHQINQGALIDGKETGKARCPDLVVVDIFDDKYLSFEKFLYLGDYGNDIEQITIAAESLYENSDHAKLIFYYNETINDYNVIEALAGNTCIVNSYYQPFGYTTKLSDIDPIVKKYLDLGFTDVLAGINSSISTKKDGAEVISENAKVITDLLLEIDNFDKISTDISNDLQVLTEYKGKLSDCFNNYFDKNITSVKSYKQWFDKYAPDSPAQYAEPLVYLLKYINDQKYVLKDLIEENHRLTEAGGKLETCDDNDSDCKFDACVLVAPSTAYKDCYTNYSSPIAAEECYKYKTTEKAITETCQKKSKENKEQIENEVTDAEQNVNDRLEASIEKYFKDVFNQLGVNISDGSDFCDLLFGKDSENSLYFYIKLVINLIRIGGPILVLFLTAFDGLKTITSFKEDENKKFWGHLKIRLICLALLILLPTIIKFILDLFIQNTCDITNFK